LAAAHPSQAYSAVLDEALRMGFKPQRAGGTGGIEPEFLPPSGFIAVTMEFTMMSPAERDRELVARFAGKRPILRKTKMMGIARLASTDQAGLPGDKTYMLAIANAPRLGVRQHRLVD
jgi:hypothetical protein